MVDPARHADSRNAIESILRYIPGFRGYLEKEYRRESDELARTHLANELQRSKEAVDNYQRTLVDAAQLDALPQCERLRHRIDALQSRLRGAMQGYSGFFDFVRIGEAELDAVYQLDLALLSDVRLFRADAERLGAETTALPARIRELLTRVDELHRRFDERAQILEGLSAKS